MPPAPPQAAQRRLQIQMAQLPGPNGPQSWVDVWSGGYVQRRYVSRSPGLNADGPYREHIGLGQVDKVDLVRVRWPSGKVSELKSPKVDSVVALKEP